MNDRFLALIREIEAALRSRLGNRRSQRTGFAEMIEDYRQRNTGWQRDAEDLDILREIRNYLNHDRNHRLGDPVVVTQASIDRLIEIHTGLISPSPIGLRFRRPVVTVQSSDKLSSVLGMAYQYAFSQFPVVDGGRFNRVITENEIARWLGLQIHNGNTTVDLVTVTVQAVLREREPDAQMIFRFERLDTPEDEVMGLFQRRPDLEVVLLTESGGRNSPIEGIVTQWDAARYPNDGESNREQA